MKKYNQIRNKYPEYVSLDQMYQICSISKRSAAYLIENGIIPAVNTGKKTWKYKIAVKDIITYLSRREKVGSMIPCGAVSSKRNYQKGSRESFSTFITPGKEYEVTEYFKYIYTDFPDVLTLNDISEMTGLSKKTLSVYLKSGYIKFLIKQPQYLITKDYLLKFVSTPKYIDCKSNSEIFKKILGGFKIWKTAK